MDRRRFLGALGAAGAMAPLGALGGASLGGGRLDVIGLQLYTVRRALREDFDGTLARVADIGYSEVEFAGYFGRSPREVRAALDRAGLSAPAAHVADTAIRERPDELIEAAIAIGHRYLVVAWLDPHERATLEDWRARAREFERFGARCREAGVRFAYHNHDYEFNPIDGRIPYDILLAEADPALVELELDIYWIVKGGADPLDYLARHPGRFALTHIKDSAGAPAHEMVDVGRGVIDFARIIPAAERAGVRHHFVEHDEPADPFATIRASYDHMAGLRL